MKSADSTLQKNATKARPESGLGLVIGCSFAGFFVSSVGAFSLFFYRMGAVPIWQQAPVSRAAVATVAPPPPNAVIQRAPAARDTYKDPAQPASRAPAAIKLADPVQVSPDVESLELRWEPVPGAHRYHVHAWQMHEGDETTLLDEDTGATTVVVEPVHRAAIQWEVQAFDGNGVAGKGTGTARVPTR